MKELGYGHEYRYAHDEPHAYAAGKSYLPEGMKEPAWYQTRAHFAALQCVCARRLRG
jgi:putative ATPase